MPQETTTAQHYTLDARRTMAASFIGPLLESAQHIPHIHEFMPEPFDITNHARPTGHYL